MLRRDLLMAEIQKLSLALTKLSALKHQGKALEMEKELDELLEQEFGILYSDFLASTDHDLTLFFKEKNLPPAQLDLLSQLLFLRMDFNIRSTGQIALSQKLIFLYNYLEKNHQVINMLNISRQQDLTAYLA